MDEEENETSGPGGWKVWLSWALVAPILIWATGRTFGLERGFPWVQAMAYTPYALLLALVICLAVVLIRQWIPFLVGLLTVIALGLAVIPRELGAPDQVSGGTEVRLLSFNLLRGRADTGELTDLIRARQVDLLTLQELTPEADEELKASAIGRLLPYQVVGTKGDGGGGIYSRFPLTRVTSGESGYRQPRAIVRMKGMMAFELMSVHPMAPAGPTTTTEWRRDFSKLPRADEPGPARVLAGDFNATLDHKNLRELIDSGYRDAADTLGRGLITTWPSTLKWPLPVTIDHALVEEPIAITGYDIEGIDGSDHRAVYTELSIPEENETRQLRQYK